VWRRSRRCRSCTPGTPRHTPGLATRRAQRQEHQAPHGGDRRGLVPDEVDVLAVVHDENPLVPCRGRAAEHHVQEVSAAFLVIILPDDVQDQVVNQPVQPPRHAVAPCWEEAHAGHLRQQVGLGHRLLQLPHHRKDPLALVVTALKAGPGDHIGRVLLSKQDRELTSAEYALRSSSSLSSNPSLTRSIMSSHDLTISDVAEWTMRATIALTLSGKNSGARSLRWCTQASPLDLRMSSPKRGRCVAFMWELLTRSPTTRYSISLALGDNL
jgi:hypothetical protein